MEPNRICQSCTMPLDTDEMCGTEKDGERSHEYCMYCYQHGEFTRPGMTLEEMRQVVREQMEKQKIDETIIQLALKALPGLKRWLGAGVGV